MHYTHTFHLSFGALLTLCTVCGAQEEEKEEVASEPMPVSILAAAYVAYHERKGYEAPNDRDALEHLHAWLHEASCTTSPSATTAHTVYPPSVHC